MERRDAFISYVEEDVAFVLALTAELRSLGHSTWTYHEDGIPGVSYLEQVYDAIENGAVFVLVASRDSVRSHQVIREVEQAHERGRLIPPIRLGITHQEFASANPILRMASGTAVSMASQPNDVRTAASRIQQTIRFNVNRHRQREAPESVSAHSRDLAARSPHELASDHTLPLLPLSDATAEPDSDLSSRQRLRRAIASIKRIQVPIIVGMASIAIALWIFGRRITHPSPPLNASRTQRATQSDAHLHVDRLRRQRSLAHWTRAYSFVDDMHFNGNSDLLLARQHGSVIMWKWPEGLQLASVRKHTGFGIEDLDVCGESAAWVETIDTDTPSVFIAPLSDLAAARRFSLKTGLHDISWGHRNHLAFDRTCDVIAITTDGFAADTPVPRGAERAEMTRELRMVSRNGTVLQMAAESGAFISATRLTDRVVTGDDETPLSEWDFSSGTKTREFQVRGFPKFSPDGNWLSATNLGTIYVWPTSDYRRIRTLEAAHTYDVAFSPKSPVAASVESSKEGHWLVIWNVSEDIHLLKRMRVTSDGTTEYDSVGGVRSVAFSPDGRNILIGTGNNSIQVWGDQ